jgi:hypothetical protein
MSFNDPITWAIVIVGGFILLTIIRSLINPPRAVSWLEVPEEIRREAELSLPGFVVDSVRYSPVMKSYRAEGTYREKSGKLEIECNSKGGIREIEYEERQSKVVNRKQSCHFSDLPPAVLEHLNQLLGDEVAGFQPGFITRGSMRDDDVFEIKGRTSRWKWEVEMTGQGRLLELEKEVLRR